MKLIIVYISNEKTPFFKYINIHFLTGRLYVSPISIEAFIRWIQRGSITKIGKLNEDK